MVAHAPEIPTPSADQAHIVVLRGDDALSRWVGERLASDGYKSISIATTPQGLVEQTRNSRPDLVLVISSGGASELDMLSGLDTQRLVLLTDQPGAARALAGALKVDDVFALSRAHDDFARRIRLNAEIAVLHRHLAESGALMSAAVKRKMARLEKGLALLRDAHAQIEKQLEDARERTRNAMALPAGLVHELRTPLGAISGFAEVMRREEYGPLGGDKYREYAAAIHQASGHLLDLVNDLMDLYKIEAGQLTIECKPVDLRQVVRSVFGLLSLQAQQAHIRLEHALSRTVPLIQTDEGRLRQILINLVGNAVKFTRPEGCIEVTAERSPSGDKVAILVRDDGIGMSEDEVRAALSPFGQAQAGSMIGRGGTGLGLPVSKMLVERLGGTFELLSRPGQGTTATVLLPV